MTIKTLNFLFRIFVYLATYVLLVSCDFNKPNASSSTNPTHKKPFTEDLPKTNFFLKLSETAISLTKQKVTYDASYFVIDYPNGDVPANKGVCCDVVIRAYRKLGIDLQKEVHEDMKANFSAYPNKWGLSSTDKNIDHRRVPNLMKFFERKKASLPISTESKNYKFGDVVCWDLGNGLTHIGIVVTEKTADNQRNLIVHNIGNGQVLEDCLFKYKIIGHYRFKA